MDDEKKSLSAVEQIIKAIKNMIIEQDLHVGDKIPNEFELSTMFGKSRGVVREAVKILDSYGVLDVRRGDGT
jgi:DNA-binding FadR family transcriptional regulator